MSYTPLYAPVAPNAHITGSIECLFALAAGDSTDCNAAAKAQVAIVEQAFDGIMEMLAADSTFNDLTSAERDEFTYYAIMEEWGHGVGLRDNPDQWSEEAIEKARDKNGPINQAVRRLVVYLDDLSAYPSVYTLEVTARVAVITEESSSYGEPEMSISIPADAAQLRDWKSWVDGYSRVPNEKRGDDEPPLADEHGPEEYTPLEFTRLLDEIGAEFSGGGWSVYAGDQELLAENGYRRFPGVQRADESWHDVIGASLELFIKIIKLNDDDDPDFDEKDIEAGRDSRFK